MLTINNWPGLMASINAAGYHVDQRDGVLIGIRSSDGATGADIDAAVQQIDDTYPVATAADYVCKAIEALATAKRNLVVAPYSPGEMASWPIKRAEALAYQASGNAADAPNLSNEATARGITLAALVAKVLADAARFAGVESAIAGTSGKHRDAVRALATHADIMAYDYTTGWPL
jgi:predicted P-loop ATPase